MAYADLKANSVQLSGTTTSLLNSSGMSSDGDLLITTAATKSITIGTDTSTTLLKGTSTATTVATATDSSTNIATTAFVQLLKSIANTWAMLQTFTTGILTSSVNPLTSGNLAIGSSMTTGTNITIGPSTETSITNIYGKNTNIATNQLSTTIIGTNTGNLQLNGAIIINANSSYNIDIGRTAGGITTMKSPTIHCGQTTAGSTTNVTGATVNVNTTSGATNIGNATGLCKITGLQTAKVDSTDATTTQTIGGNLTTGSLSIGSGALTTGSITIGRSANTYSNGSQLKLGAFKNIEYNIIGGYNRIYRQVFGEASSAMTGVEQVCYANISTTGGVVTPFFQLDCAAGTSYTSQLFDITVCGWIDAVGHAVFRGSFCCIIGAANTVCSVSGSAGGIFTYGYQVNTSASLFTFTLSENRVVVNYTQSYPNNWSNLTAKLTSNICRNNTQWLMTPLS